ncbi:MAG: YdiY family protein [Tepidisphaerales bacterium]
MLRSLSTGVLAVLAAVSAAWGGEVVFKNGDRLTGEVTRLEGGKLKIKSAVAGEVTVDLKDVASFSTDEPIEIKLADGSVVKQQVQRSETPGTIQTAPSAAGVAASTLSLDQVVAINEPKVETRWTGNIRAGALLSRGNTDSDAFNLAGDAQRRTADDRLSLSGQYLYARSRKSGGEKETTTDNWFAQVKYDYFVSKKLYFYAVARFERDNIADLNLRALPGVGIGYQWLEGPKQNFRTEAGVGLTYEDYRGEESETYPNARLAYAYDRVLVDNVRFIHNLEYLPSLEDFGEYIINTDAGIRVNLSARFFTDFKVELKYNARPEADVSRSDLRYILAVGWQF